MDFYTMRPIDDDWEDFREYQAQLFCEKINRAPDDSREGPVEVMVPGFEDFICQYGWCESCGIELASNCKQICCPRCGEPAYLT